MPVILKIGFDYYLVKSEAQAIAALKALSEALPVDRSYNAKLGDVFYPESEKSQRHKEIGIQIIRREQVLPRKPREEGDDCAREVKLLDFNGKVHYTE